MESPKKGDMASALPDGSQADNEPTVVDPNSPMHRAAFERLGIDRTIMDKASSAGFLDDKTVVQRDDMTVPDTHDGKTVVEKAFTAGAASNEPRRALAPKPAAPNIALPVGFRLFEYRIDGILGQGGFGIA